MDDSNLCVLGRSLFFATDAAPAPTLPGPIRDVVDWEGIFENSCAEQFEKNCAALGVRAPEKRSRWTAL